MGLFILLYYDMGGAIVAKENCGCYNLGRKFGVK